MDIYIAVDKAIDEVFQNDRYVLNLYQFAKGLKLKRRDMTEFIHSSTTKELSDLITELDSYIKGGRDREHEQLREAYGHIPKPKARKIRKYLVTMLEDAVRYEQEKRPGRKKA